jgi:hypothetical protein
MEPNVELLLGISGAILCLGGWILFHVGTRLVGVAIGLGFGFGFGMALGMVLRLTPGGEQLVMLACSLLGAIGGFIFVRFATSFLFALAGFLFGAMLGRVGSDIHATLTHTSPAITPAVAAAIAISGFVVAILAIVLQKLIVVIITSFVGATFLTAAIPRTENFEVWVLLGFFIGSVVWQLLLTRYILADKAKAESDG